MNSGEAGQELNDIDQPDVPSILIVAGRQAGLSKPNWTALSLQYFQLSPPDILVRELLHQWTSPPARSINRNLTPEP